MDGDNNNFNSDGGVEGHRSFDSSSPSSGMSRGGSSGGGGEEVHHHQQDGASRGDGGDVAAAAGVASMGLSSMTNNNHNNPHSPHHHQHLQQHHPQQHSSHPYPLSPSGGPPLRQLQSHELPPSVLLDAGVAATEQRPPPAAPASGVRLPGSPSYSRPTSAIAAGPAAAAAAAAAAGSSLVASTSSSQGSSLLHQSQLRQQAHSPVLSSASQGGGGGGGAAAAAAAAVAGGSSPSVGPAAGSSLFGNHYNRGFGTFRLDGSAASNGSGNGGNNSNPSAGGAAGGVGGGNPRNNVPEREAEELGFSPSSGWSDVELTPDGGGGIPPSARSLHAAALLNGIMYVFGGYDGTQRVNTFHAFSFAEKRWSPVLPSANSAPPPSPRDRHVAVAFGNSIFIHGGFDGVSRVSDFWGFDFSTMTWREVHALQGRSPSPRHSHAAVVHGSSLYVFGGYDGSYKADLHEFDFTLSRWGVVPAAGRRPRARYRATCVTHKSQMILYGGHDGTRHLSDAHVFDFDTRTWNNLVCEGTPPIPRDSHVSVVHGNCMYVFGGSSGSAMNDLHELQLPSNATSVAVAKWRAVHTSRTDQPRPRFCHVAVVWSDALWCFGGYDGSDRLNDFIRFDFAVYDLSFEVPPASIIQDLRSLINDPTLSDITFLVEDQPVHAHKVLLMRSSYFQALFLGSMRESSLDTIRLEQVRYPVFLTVLEYLYTDQVLITLNDAMELFEAADLFCIPRLKTMCEKRMLQSITVANAAAIFHAADLHSAAALRQKAKKYILSHFEEVSKSSSFEEMGRRNIDLVFELLQSR